MVRSVVSVPAPTDTPAFPTHINQQLAAVVVIVPVKDVTEDPDVVVDASGCPDCATPLYAVAAPIKELFDADRVITILLEPVTESVK